MLGGWQRVSNTLPRTATTGGKGDPGYLVRCRSKAQGAVKETLSERDEFLTVADLLYCRAFD